MEHSQFDHVQLGEKNSLLPQTVEYHDQGHARGKSRKLAKTLHVVRLAIFFVAVCAWCRWWYPIIPGFPRPGDQTRETGKNEKTQVGFDEITPSEKLEWHPCYGWLRCARLTVPMDYHRPLSSLDSPKVHIALLLVPGNHNGSKKFSTSPLLINPGGPGGSGVQFALREGFQLQQVVGEDQDLIGFDPRGIGSTTPNADCFSFETSEPDAPADLDAVYKGIYHRYVWEAAGSEIGLVNSSSSSLQKLDTRRRALAKLCEAKDSFYDKDSILKYVNTPNVARDMLSIINAWDEWTDSLSGESSDSSEILYELKEENDDGSGVFESSPSLDTKGKLVYWGFSYGTLLGATFASMFPDKVGRVILDGVVDADLYVSPLWSDSIRDADSVWASFFEYCHKAKKACALYRENDEVTDIEKRFEALMARIKEQPIVLIENLSFSPFIVTDSLVRLFLFTTLYSPIQTFPVVAMFLNEAFEGNYGALQSSLPVTPLFELEYLCKKQFPASLYPKEAMWAIMCSDKRYPFNETLPNLEIAFEQMSNTSSWADVWLTIMLGCEGWAVKSVDPPMRWDDHPAHKLKPIKTSYPVLFISNTADPVTPLLAGVKMAKKFVNAGLIEQESGGHCSLAAVSRCTIDKIRAYLINGTVPPPPVVGGKGRELADGKWDKCKADEWPFHPFVANEWVTSSGAEGMMELKQMTALKEIQETFRESRGWMKVGPGMPY